MKNPVNNYNNKEDEIMSIVGLMDEDINVNVDKIKLENKKRSDYYVKGLINTKVNVNEKPFTHIPVFLLNHYYSTK